MPTSIRELLQTLEDEARYAAGTERQSRDAAGALVELGRTLRQLSQDGLELDVHGRRETIARELADSCEQHAALDMDRAGRLTSLAGGVADITGALRMETGRDQRWAIAVEVAGAARVLTTYAAEGGNRPTVDLAWTHLTARALMVQALKDTPSAQARAVLDRPVPRATLTPDMSAAEAALESLTVISDRLRRSAADLGRRPTLLEVFAVTRAAESTTRYATTAAAALVGEATPDARPAAAIWYEVRDRLRPFVTAAPLHLEDRDVGLWAQRTHSELRREFGSADAPQLHVPSGELKVAAVQHLQVMANEVPAIAEHVATAVQQLADHGELHALADRLPFREQRVEQFLSRHAVVADRFDVVTVMDKLGDAAKLGAGVATSLNHARGPGSPELQPDLAAANAARATPVRADPHAALVAQVGEKIGTPTKTEIVHEPHSELHVDGLTASHEIEPAGGPDWGVD